MRKCTKSTWCLVALLDGIVGAVTFSVNSVHGQGANRLAPTARAEAYAPDGLV